MTVRSVPIFLQAGSHPAEETRLMLGGMLGTVTGSFAGGVASSDPAHGVVRATDFAVSQNGTPNMSVNVAAGGAFIRGTQSANQGAYHVYNDATVNLAVTAADATNGRRDLVIAQVRDAYYSGATNDARITIVTGTAAASPVDPSLASFPNALVLARITVAALDTAINTADITDVRPIANIAGELPSFTTAALASTAIPSPVDGQGYYLNTGTTTEGPWYWHGSAYRQPWNMPWGFVQYTQTTSNVSVNNGNILLGNTISVVNNRRYRIVGHCNSYYSNSVNDVAQVSIVVGGTVIQATNVTNTLATFAAYGVEVVGYYTATATNAALSCNLYNVAIVGTGTHTFQASTTFPTFIAVEDIGPSGAPA